MQPRSTVDNSTQWRLFHGINYLIGGTFFLVGSFVLLPFLSTYFNTASVSAWLYTVGSFTFLVADITEWLHYTHKSCPFLLLSINFAISMTGSALYLIGSICFIPSLNAAMLGYFIFIVGSCFIVVSQSWKTIRTLFQPCKSWMICIKEDISGFYVDLFAGQGGLMYLIGTFLILSNQIIIGVVIYCLGGLFFSISASFMQIRYFSRKNRGVSILQLNKMMLD